MTGFRHVRETEDGRTYVVEAEGTEGIEGQEVALRRARVTFDYAVKGKMETGSIVSDECLYTPTTSAARFRGHVKVETPDGFNLETEAMSLDSNTGMARTESGVTFRRKDVSGSGRGL